MPNQDASLPKLRLSVSFVLSRTWLPPIRNLGTNVSLGFRQGRIFNPRNHSFAH